MKNKPFYKKKKFWLIIAAIFAIAITLFCVYEYIALQQHLSDTVEKIFYESGKGGTKITDIADDYACKINQSTTYKE